MSKPFVIRAMRSSFRLARHWLLDSQWRLCASLRDPIPMKRHGLKWELRADRYVDREVALGTFEKNTIRRLKVVVKPGFHALDVGANFGYFSLLMASLAGADGHVWSSEPTRHYRERLLRHIELNQMKKRVTVLPFGLSNADAKACIRVGTCSATMHPVGDYAQPQEETILLRPLDPVASEIGIKRLDFIKIDIDGHEPSFFEGARSTIAAFRPAMVIEFNQPNLEVAGFHVDTLRKMLEGMGYALRSEKTWAPYASRLDFLRECGNYCMSANAWAFPIESFSDSERAHLKRCR